MKSYPQCTLVFCPAKPSLYLVVIICRRFSGVQTKTDCGQLKFVCDLQLSEIRLQCCTPKQTKKLKVQAFKAWFEVAPLANRPRRHNSRLSWVEFNFHLLLTRKGFSPSSLVFSPRKCQCYSHFTIETIHSLLCEKPTLPHRNSICIKILPS